MTKFICGVILLIVVVFSFVVHWYFTAYWYLIIKPENQILIFTAILSMIGALIGSISGGFLSYIGNKVGVKDNFKLMRSWNEQNATKQLINQLKYTMKTAQIASEMWEKIQRDKPDFKLTTINFSLYDTEWPRELGSSKLDNDEFETVVNWYTQLDLISENGDIDVATLVKINHVHSSKINKIIEKYDH